MRTTTIMAALGIIAQTASAQTPAPNNYAAAVRGGFAEASGWVTKGADIVPADKYSYKPVATVRSFGELVAHVVDGNNYYCALASGKKAQWSDATEKGKTDKATVTAKLKASIATCTAAYASGGAKDLVGNLGHVSLHYGNMITYIRMLGLVPPST